MPREAHTLEVPAAAKGERLDAYLAQALPSLSRSRLKSLIEEGLVLLGGRPAKASSRLKGGEAVTVDVPPQRPLQARAQKLPLSVLYEDDELLVLDKAAGMVVHPAAGNWEGTLVNALLHRVAQLAGVGDRARPGLVHRLDKDTSGCLVVAKTEPALRALQAAFKEHQVEKIYLALVHGSPGAQGTIRTLFGRHPVHRKRFTGKVREGKPAVTHYRVLEKFEGAALVEITLETGRTHQIRVHLSEAGHPLLGDKLYGGHRKAPPNVASAAKALGRQALHAARLAFPHPRTGQRVTFEAPLPEDFLSALRTLRA